MNNNLGKVPPQAVEVEEAVLGALMLERSAYQKVSSILTIDSFYTEVHQTIFKTIQSLVNKGRPIDLLIVTQELKNTGKLDTVGGCSYITQLTNKVASASHIEHHARIVEQSHIARQIIKITAERGAQAYDQSYDIADILSGLQNDLIGLFQHGHGTETTMADGLVEILKIVAFNQKNVGMSGIGTGLHKLDKFTGGLQKTDLVVIAGDSSQGKTSFALTILKNAVMNYKARAAIYSLEMSKSQLIARIISTVTDIPAKDILGRCLTFEEAQLIERATVQLNPLPVYFNEGSCSTIDEICNSIRRLTLKQKINLVMVDYVQLVETDRGNKSEEGKIAEVARKLKNIAKELNIVVIALSQFSIDKVNPRPTITRLRGSGQINEASDLTLLVWRPETYGLTEFTKTFEGTPSAGLAECMIAKGRNVGTGTFLLSFNPKTTGFYDYEPKFNNSASYNADRNIEPENTPF